MDQENETMTGDRTENLGQGDPPGRPLALQLVEGLASPKGCSLFPLHACLGDILRL